MSSLRRPFDGLESSCGPFRAVQQRPNLSPDMLGFLDVDTNVFRLLDGIIGLVWAALIGRDFWSGTDNFCEAGRAFH